MWYSSKGIPDNTTLFSEDEDDIPSSDLGAPTAMIMDISRENSPPATYEDTDMSDTEGNFNEPLEWLEKNDDT